MKLIRYGQPGKEQPGLHINGINYDASAFGGDYDEHFFENDGLSRLQAFVQANQNQLVAIPEEERIGSPVARPSKIVGVGLNYADHAAETGAQAPKEPVLFLKSTSSFCGPYDDVILPKGSLKTDWEVELAVVIGKKASYVDEAEAADYIAGYMLMNDVSEREYQMERGGTWDKGKGCDTFGPAGPWLVTPDALGDVNYLRLQLAVNGELRQDGSTGNLIFKVPYLIAYISRMMTLLPGDVIATGTPAGVGLGMKPPVFLKAGDVMELSVEGLGSARQKVVAIDR